MKKFFVALLIAGTACAQAQVTYTYTGQNFTDFAYDDGGETYPSNIFTSSDNISFSFTFAQALPANSTTSFNSQFVNTSYDYPPLSWDVKASVINSSQITSFYFDLSTDSSGAISGWSITFEQNLPDYNGPGTVIGGVDSYVSSRWDPNVNPNRPGIAVDSAATCQGDVFCLDDQGFPVGGTVVPGTWQVSSVPEPDIGTTVALGLGSMLLFARWSRRGKKGF